MTLRKIIFWSHLTVGLSVGVVIVSMCGTGMLLAFEPQIIARAERAIQQVVPPPGGVRLSNEALTEKARAAKSDAKLSVLFFKTDPTASVMAGFGRDGILFLNPYTGDVLGSGSKTRQFLHQVEDWHRWLGNKKIGKPITGATAIAFLLLSLSGLTLWWPRRVFSLGKHGRGLMWNWHNTFGISITPFIWVITCTGIIIAYGLFKKPAQPKPPEGTVRIITLPRAEPKVFRDWVVPLHTGRAWGVPGQTINFFVALSGIVLVGSGFTLAWRRWVGRRVPPR